MSKGSSTPSKKKAVLEAFRKKAGNVSEACKAANVGRRSFYLWQETDKEFAEAAKDVLEGLKDHAVSKLHQAIDKGESWAICFFLKCQAKDRGYIERLEHTGIEGGPITFRVIYEKPKNGGEDGD